MHSSAAALGYTSPMRKFIGLLLGCWLLLHGGMAVAMAYCPHLPASHCHEPQERLNCDHCAYCLAMQAPVLPAAWAVILPEIPAPFGAVRAPVYHSHPTEPRYHPPCG